VTVTYEVLTVKTYGHVRYNNLSELLTICRSAVIDITIKTFTLL